MAETPMIIKDLTLGTDTATAYNFPSADGANTEVLTTDGAGNLSFAAAGGGGMTSFDMDGDTGAAFTVTNGDTVLIVNAAGGAIKTVAQAPDTITIDLTVTAVNKYGQFWEIRPASDSSYRSADGLGYLMEQAMW